MTQQADVAEFFREITLGLCSSLDLEVSLHRCLRVLRGRVPVDEIWANILDLATWTIQPVAMAALSGGKAFGDDGPRVPLSDSARAELRGAPAKPVQRLDNADEDPVTREAAAYYKTPTGSYLNMRLSVEGQRVGAITLRNRKPAAFRPEHEELVAALREPFTIALSNYVRHRQVLKLQELLAEDNRYLHRELVRLTGDEIVGGDLGMKGVLDQVARVAPTPSPVLLFGETGVGKEVVANAIHRLSPRSGGPLIKVNCGAVPESLVDSELFGHEKGAFTGAVERKRGLFERADHGTLFLDEVGELPQSAQVRLLRALQEKEIQRVGGHEAIRIDIRVVAATHRDLQAMIKQGSFREDLWFRLAVFPIEIPPLRQRRGDIPALVDHLVRLKCRELKRDPPPGVTPASLERLLTYDWPGNVRELQNIIERAIILSGEGPLDLEGLLPAGDPARAAEATHPAVGLSDGTGCLLPLTAIEAAHISRVLDEASGRIEGKGGAAEILGMNPSTLRHRMRKLGIPFGRAELR